MKFKGNSRRKALVYEKAMVEFWKKHKVFEKSVAKNEGGRDYVFYDGPPFITGVPHHGTLLSSIVKDAVPRFWTMRGRRVERKWGWDCHGLPAENFVEKQLGIVDRRQIVAGSGSCEVIREGKKLPTFSLENYILEAKDSMRANSETWEDVIDRVGRWVDFKGAYKTMDKDYMESVWWAFSELYKKGKIYEGRKVLMYDTKFGTPVSKAEVVMDNDAYKEVTDPSAYVKFKVVNWGEKFGVVSENDKKVYLLAWTTTPWTLPANMALVVNPKMKYGLYEVEEEKYVLGLVAGERIFPGLKPEKEFLGKELVGLKYESVVEMPEQLVEKTGSGKDTWTVVAGEFVSDAEGTGVVHAAPAYGEDDYALLSKYEINFVDVVDENGYYLPLMREVLGELGVRDTDEHGVQIWAGNKFIAKVLEEKGKVLKIEYIKHEYPFNPRSKERIMYRAFPSWFFDVEGSKELMIEKNENINWFPGYLKEGRFKKNIEAAPDWNLSRDRFWATAMPVWKGEKTGAVKVFGSYDELEEYSGVRLEDYHRPWVDEIEFEAMVSEKGEVVAMDKNGKGVRDKFKRIDKVLDCWFESGSMPFAQFHYPFENKEKFEKSYPGDFIVEYVGQVRAWFYYVHAVNTALFGKEAYKNVITTGTLAGNDGRKMSKSLGNFTDPNVLMDQYSADSLRFLLLSSPVLAGEDFALLDKDVSDVARKLLMIWNVYDFFTMYAEVDGVDSEELAKVDGQSANLLDKWIVARVWSLRNEITEGMEEYNLPKALAGVLPFVDDLSNWFVRRSRRRFWKSEDDKDKTSAYATLYYVLVYLAQILAPFVPFLAEELWQKLTGKEQDSVHLLDWPEAGTIDTKVLDDMARAREIITDGLALRMRKTETEEQVKVRQPLAKLVYVGEKLEEFYEKIITEEVNVKEVACGEEMWLDKTIGEELAKEGFVRELVRFVQAARKKAGLLVDDRIMLSVSVELDEKQVKVLMEEVLAVDLVTDGVRYRLEDGRLIKNSDSGLGENYQYDEIVKVKEKQVVISLQKN